MKMKTKDVCDNSATILPPIARMEWKSYRNEIFRNVATDCSGS